MVVELVVAFLGFPLACLALWAILYVLAVAGPFWQAVAVIAGIVVLMIMFVRAIMHGLFEQVMGGGEKRSADQPQMERPLNDRERWQESMGVHYIGASEYVASCVPERPANGRGERCFCRAYPHPHWKVIGTYYATRYGIRVLYDDQLSDGS